MNVKTVTGILLTASSVWLSADDNIQQPLLKQLSMKTNGIELHWSCPLTDELEMFEITRESDGTNVVFTLNPLKLQRYQMAGEAETFHWTDTNIVAGVNYTYVVRSHSSGQESDPSNPLEGHISIQRATLGRSIKPVSRRPQPTPFPVPPQPIPPAQPTQP